MMNKQLNTNRVANYLEACRKACPALVCRLSKNGSKVLYGEVHDELLCALPEKALSFFGKGKVFKMNFHYFVMQFVNDCRMNRTW